MNYPKERFAMDAQVKVMPAKPPRMRPAGSDIGAIAGDYAGKGIAENVDAAAEEAYWREKYKDRPYAAGGSSYDEFGPAYRYGVAAFVKSTQRSFDQAEPDLSRGWSTARGTSSLDWDRAKYAVRDAWNRLGDSLERAMPGDADRDGK